jgi:hypothetical protein
MAGEATELKSQFGENASTLRDDKALLLPGVSAQRLQEDWHALNAGILGLAAAGCCG